MWKVRHPALTAAAETYAACISTIRDLDLRGRLTIDAPAISRADKAYTAAAAAGDFSQLSATTLAMPQVTAKEMAWVYDKRMAAKGSAGRRIYDQLILAAEQGRCPLCGQRDVSTLDHYIPKTVIPALAVNPYNLLPACADCNWLKRDLMPASASEATLHPYFDDVDSAPWLTAQVRQTNPASFRFHVTAPPAWDAVTSARAARHFTVFRLGQLYSAQAAQELINIRYSLRVVTAARGPAGVQQHLAREAESRRDARLNSWQSATYTAMAADTWFCTNGFELAG